MTVPRHLYNLFQGLATCVLYPSVFVKVALAMVKEPRHKKVNTMFFFFHFSQDTKTHQDHQESQVLSWESDLHDLSDMKILHRLEIHALIRWTKNKDLSVQIP